MRRKEKQVDRQVTWALIEPTGQVGDKGTATVTPTRFGYETKFDREVTVLKGDRLIVDWEKAYE